MSQPNIIKKAVLHREALEHLDESIELHKKAVEKLERFKANFVMYPFGPEGTTVSRREWEKEK